MKLWPGLKSVLLVLLLIAAVTSCGGKRHKPTVVENPYASRAQDFINNGKIAMQQEHWQGAAQSFSRALMAAQLADNTQLISQSWYNLAVARAAMGLRQKAEDAYNRAIRLAEQHQYDIMQMRARLALTLLRLRFDAKTPEFSLYALFNRKNWPADIYLQAARIAQLQKQPKLADNAYLAVLNLKGKSNTALKMKAQAHMGLALLAKAAGETDEARHQADKTLILCRQIGAARLSAHALLLKGQLPAQSGVTDNRQGQLQRALDIYLALKDMHGQKQTLVWLSKLATAAGDQQMVKRIELRLKALNDKLEP